jgi:7,8-dihydropterin-6-yl-methyl-4-(beta-D-ribofuranosyl)aminobenzene 5'-phosphate synthase
MRITTLIENTRLPERQDLQVEYGLSLHMDLGDRQILFDTGATGAFCDNAERLGIRIQDVDLAILSHRHFDHGGGLARFLETNQKAKVVLRRAPEREYTFRAWGVIHKAIGVDKSLFQRYGKRFEFVDAFTEVAPRVFILTNIEKPYPPPRGNRHLYADQGDVHELDRFEHELIAVIQKDDGLVVLTGCSHSGILNMIDTVVKQFPGLRIKAVLGGFHLIGLPLLNTMASSRQEVAAMAGEVLRYPVDRLYTGHCTGPKAYRVLKEVLGERLEEFPTGRSIEV